MSSNLVVWWVWFSFGPAFPFSKWPIYVCVQCLGGLAFTSFCRFIFRSVYRELLFLSLTACGTENIDVGKGLKI